MLTISRLSRWSINYYNDTARQAAQSGLDRQRANGGLGEYYSEGDTRTPTWLIAGDTARTVELVGLDGRAVDGGSADPEVVQRWLDDGIAPNGAAGRAFSKGSVHGFDLTFAAPKSVSLLRALTDDRAEKAMQVAHQRAVSAAMDYLHQHAGYTRVHNPLTGMKDLQRLPGLVAIAYQHETSRCGDPHLHTHVIVPNRQARADGALVSLDSKSLFHEAKAAGVIYQAVLRHELHAELMLEWAAVDPFTGMAEIAAVPKQSIRAWSRRSSRLREWAHQNLVIVDGALSAQQLAAAQKATRPAKPEATSWAELKAAWRADVRGLALDRAAHLAARTARRAAARVRLRGPLVRAVAQIDKAAFTRADLVELVGALLPVDAPGEPRDLIEGLVDMFGVRISAARAAHHREGHELFTVAAVIAEEARIFELVDATDTRSRLDVRTADLEGLSVDQARAIAAIAHSPYLVQPLQAPAGAGKTHSLRALRAAAARTAKEVLLFAPTGKAVDEALREDAGDRGFTVAKALQLLDDGQLTLDRRTVIVVDEAAMVGTPELRRLLEAAAAAGTKLVLVGDGYQLAPVKARGGMFEQLCTDLPWAQRLSEVWRMRDPAERDASLALRSGRGNRLRKAVGWYRSHDRLRTGDAVTMAADATTAYITARAEGKDAAILCDTWDIADAINQRLHDHYTRPDAPSVQVARDQQARAGDLILSRHNDATVAVEPGTEHRRGSQQIDQVRNGNRWRVVKVDAQLGRLAAERLTDSARVIFDADYLREHITLGYASTVHSAQGLTVGNSTTSGVCWTILSDRASRCMAYVGMTRGRDENHLAIYAANEADHQGANIGIQPAQRGTKTAASQRFRMILANDDRARTMHAVAAQTDRNHLPAIVADSLDRNGQRLTQRAHAWRQHTVQTQAREAAYQRLSATLHQDVARERSRGWDRDYGLEL
ncbi:MobF family relaxase [Mycobacterium conspicuum]|uniref:TraA/ATP-dependent exoDNAse/relaxase n=1 Tax=Mycobacterium conspicuum TaxID=44010 RepID=A0A1X1TB49_9MYCO|nr:MobF family relaxase [Mycobacterium conspicuum]ORV41718.1 AAA family ATPase [Mycobacterium conspicuum]BBZ40621.1 TraA/ATP-dependent exoDNAse/relaxase [Mycobacterium conspicuum]